MLPNVNIPLEITANLHELYSKGRLPDSRTCHSTGCIREQGFIGAIEEVDIKAPSILFENSAVLTAKVFKAAARDHISLAEYPYKGKAVRMYSPNFELTAPQITIGPYVEVLEGSAGTLICEEVSFIPLSLENDLSPGQETLKSWALPMAKINIDAKPV